MVSRYIQRGSARPRYPGASGAPYRTAGFDGRVSGRRCPVYVVDFSRWCFLLILSAYLFYRRAKARGKSALQDLAQSDIFAQGNVEVSFLGGLASLKVNRLPADRALPDSLTGQNLQLEDPETIRIRELTQLAQMLEKDLITLDEYSRAKKHILKSIEP